MPKVWNKRDPNCPKDAVYVGRPSKWGNPYIITTERTREECVTMYEKYIKLCIIRNLLDISELKGKDLCCWCKPAQCHADILLELANKESN